MGRNQVVRYLRSVPLAGIVGVVHPAIAFAARDIAGQVGIELPNDQELAAKHARVSSVVNVCAIASVVVMVVLLVLSL